MRVEGVLVRGLAAGIASLALIGAADAGADVRFASPGGTGPADDGGCSVANPCSLEGAVEGSGGFDDVVDEDEVRLLPGPYDIGGAVIGVNDAITIQPDAPGRPLISGSAGFIFQVTDAATIRDISLLHASPGPTGSALFVRNGADGALVERVAVRMSGGKIACNMVEGTLRDSTCLAETSGASGAGSFLTAPAGTYSSNLVNVTAFGAESGILVDVPIGGSNFSVAAENTIASGGAGPDVFVDNNAGTGASAVLSNSNFDTSDDDGTGTSVSPPGSATNQTAAPLLIHAPGFEGDFHQLAGSPTIDAGTPGLLGTQDIDRALRTQGSSPDIGADEFPGTPALTGATPASPANDNSPRVQGSAPSTSTVRVFATADCSGPPLATGAAAELGSPGLAVSVADNSTTQLRATSADVGGGPQSACSTAIAFTEDSTAPSAPQITATDPSSPANDTNPEVRGTAEAGSTVRVFATPDCSGTPLATGTAAEFASPGLTVALADDATTSLRASATDAAGNVSACSAPVAYVEDSPAVPLPDTKAPTVTITSRPKAVIKTRKRTAPFSVGFSADESASFRCSLDRAAPVACTSPFTGRAKKGKHAVSVTATDVAGNASAAATATWKVKRKKKRRR